MHPRELGLVGCESFSGEQCPTHVALAETRPEPRYLTFPHAGSFILCASLFGGCDGSMETAHPRHWFASHRVRLLAGARAVVTPGCGWPERSQTAHRSLAV